jgi:hypothetical protein
MFSPLCTLLSRHGVTYHDKKITLQLQHSFIFSTVNPSDCGSADNMKIVTFYKCYTLQSDRNLLTFGGKYCWYSEFLPKWQ